MKAKDLLQTLSQLSEEELSLPVILLTDVQHIACKARCAEVDYIDEDGDFGDVDNGEEMFVISD